MKKKGSTTQFHLEAETADMLRAMNRVIPAVERRNTLPILSCVELAAGFGTIAVRATDLDVELRSEFEGRGEGAICLPAYRLRDFLKAVSHIERVNLSANPEGVVTVSAGSTIATMNALPAEDFPNLNLGEMVWSTPLGEGVFQFLVGGVLHAMSSDECRYCLNGVCLEVRNGALLAVATDGHRLAKRESGLASNIVDRPEAIVPRKAMTLAVPLAGRREVTIAIHKSQKNDKKAFAELLLGDVRLRTKLIDGTYPDWRHVVPEPSNTVVEFETKALRRALRATAINADSRRLRTTRFASAKAGGVEVSSRSPDQGFALARLECPVTGELPDFGVNGFYLDGIAAEMEKIGSKTIRFHVTDNSAPLRIMPDAAIVGTLNVLMPMRI